MGNFSVNHYSKITLRSNGADLTYILDIAEIPTFQLLNEWKVDAKDQPALEAAAKAHAAEWVGNLAVAVDGKPVTLRVKQVEAGTTEGAGAMPVLRVTIHAAVMSAGRVLTYEDRNFSGRAGWKEVVAGEGAPDVSEGLTVYPTDPSITPPQELSARVEWVPVAATSELRSDGKLSMPHLRPRIQRPLCAAEFYAAAAYGSGDGGEGGLSFAAAGTEVHQPHRRL